MIRKRVKKVGVRKPANRNGISSTVGGGKDVKKAKNTKRTKRVTVLPSSGLTTKKSIRAEKKSIRKAVKKIDKTNRGKAKAVAKATGTKRKKITKAKGASF